LDFVRDSMIHVFVWASTELVLQVQIVEAMIKWIKTARIRSYDISANVNKVAFVARFFNTQRLGRCHIIHKITAFGPIPAVP
jgi:hypothetical protein